MKRVNAEKREPRLEHCESCAILCDPTCIAENERDRMFQNLLQNGYRPL